MSSHCDFYRRTVKWQPDSAGGQRLGLLSTFVREVSDLSSSSLIFTWRTGRRRNNGDDLLRSFKGHQTGQLFLADPVPGLCSHTVLSQHAGPCSTAWEVLAELFWTSSSGRQQHLFSTRRLCGPACLQEKCQGFWHHCLSDLVHAFPCIESMYCVLLHARHWQTLHLALHLLMRLSL